VTKLFQHYTEYFATKSISGMYVVY